ncbi:MAG TPA: hypothetical protein VFS09_08495, partial [Candidatus Eisenbacteria bacterium]|nr:hypothetical protein [Candidatus Eisenbacteria bacterium]
MKRLRGPVTGLCATLCVVGLLVGVTTTYFSRVLFDQTMFSNRVAACFADPHVARVVAGKATDQILAMNRD